MITAENMLSQYIMDIKTRLSKTETRSLCCGRLPAGAADRGRTGTDFTPRDFKLLFPCGSSWYLEAIDGI